MIFLCLEGYSQRYINIADSCFKLKNYSCAAVNFETYLDRENPESNVIAFRAAISWALAGEGEKTFIALQRYIKNNALNNMTFYSAKLETEKGFDFIRSDSRWIAMLEQVKRSEEGVRRKEKAAVDSAITLSDLFFSSMDVRPQLAGPEAAGYTYIQLQKVLTYRSPAPFLTNNGIVLFIVIGNSQVPFYVHLAENYDPAVPSPTLVLLHGAVKMNKSYSGPDHLPFVYGMTSKHIPAYTKNYITVYPMGIDTLNWMNTNTGFDMVNKIVIKLKACLNIDDSRVALLGHSNGATGVFTYLVKSPSLYAGFYGMNTRPKVFTGGTFLRNGTNRHFYNFATDKDYYFPVAAVNTMDSLARSLGVNWHTQLNAGYPHWFPDMKESFAPMAAIFEDMVARVRDPYQKEIYWETDDIHYGSSDWISITGLDTLAATSGWQQSFNFMITQWPDNSDFNKVIYRNEPAFDYPRRSGAVKTWRKGNTINIETSAVSSIAIRLNREMIDYSKALKIYINGHKVYGQKIQPDKDYMLGNFKSQLDRKTVWENELRFMVKR